MDQIEDQKLQTTIDKLNKYHLLKRTLQLITISVFLVSLFLYYSSGFYLFPHSLNVYFSTFLFSFFSHTVERKYMFLICNGILAFLMKSSVSYTSSSPSESNLTEVKSSVVDEDVPVEIIGSLENVVLVAEQEQEQEKKEDKVLQEAGEEEEQEGQDDESLYREEEEERESVVLVPEHEEKEEARNGVSVMKQEEQDGEDAGTAATAEAANEDLMSTDELNKKIEEFIRKMKEEIRIEAQRTLIAV